MGYMLKASKEKLDERSARFGTVPKHAITEGLRIVGVANGKVYAGQKFEWHGDPEQPPMWADPLCDEGRVAYERHNQKLRKKHAERLRRREMHLEEQRRRLASMAAEAEGIQIDPAARGGHPPAGQSRARVSPEERAALKAELMAEIRQELKDEARGAKGAGDGMTVEEAMVERTTAQEEALEREREADAEKAEPDVQKAVRKKAAAKKKAPAKRKPGRPTKAEAAERRRKQAAAAKAEEVSAGEPVPTGDPVSAGAEAPTGE